MQNLFLQLPDQDSYPVPASRPRPEHRAIEEAVHSTAEIKERRRRPTAALQPLRSLFRIRVYLSLATILISFALTTGLSYFLYLSRSTQQAAAAAVLPAVAEPVTVTLVDPNFAALKAGELESVTVRRFDPRQGTKNITVDTANRTLSFVSEARGAAGGSYTGVEKDYSFRAPSYTAELGLRPIPNSSGRYLGEDDLEWQGDWQLEDPAVNAARGESYLQYLKDRFSINIKKSLATEETGTTSFSKALAEPKGAVLPPLTYDR